MARLKYDASNTYYMYEEPTLWVVPLGAGGDANEALRAFLPPIGACGAIAITAVFGAVGSGTVSGGIWIWNDNETAADDDLNIVRPNSVDESDAGRWIQFVVSCQAEARE